ncbi:pseudouridine synthase, partial [Algoriphagus aquimarinus]|uniref:pseudouridine synthase n=1 Tax=Algoriphagus aquimarinus TaxID=237018 RepID=UPI0030D929EB
VLEILFEDEYLIAINKPSGLLVHRTSIAAEETVFALQMLRDQIGQHVSPVHRLDRPTRSFAFLQEGRNSAFTKRAIR